MSHFYKLLLVYLVQRHRKLVLKFLGLIQQRRKINKCTSYILLLDFIHPIFKQRNNLRNKVLKT